MNNLKKMGLLRLSPRALALVALAGLAFFQVAGVLHQAHASHGTEPGSTAPDSCFLCLHISFAVADLVAGAELPVPGPSACLAADPGREPILRWTVLPGARSPPELSC